MYFDFHTPPAPSPLNLDLAELSGGGAAPTQFYGKTHDGRAVYVRYRGGGLSVKIAEKTGDNVYDAAPLVDVDLGPVCHGAISRAQFCRLFGVTINGSVPEEEEGEADPPFLDLTGETTFFRCFLHQVTRQTATHILHACLDHLPEATLVQPVFGDGQKVERFEETTPDQVERYEASLVSGRLQPVQLGKPVPSGFPVRKGQLDVRCTYLQWGQRDMLYASPHVQTLKAQGHEVFLVGTHNQPPENIVSYGSFSMRADFTTVDVVSRAHLAGLEPHLEAFFPETPLVQVDILNGGIVRRTVGQLDRVLSQWCLAGPERYLSVDRKERDGPRFGTRPARPEEMD